MSITELFEKLRQLAGADFTLRIDTLVLNSSMVKVEQAGSSQLEQVKLTLMLPDLTKSDYYKLQGMLGRPVDVQFGQVEADLVFEAMSTIPTDGRFESEKGNPIEMTFTSPIDASELSASLRSAGFTTYAEQIEDIVTRVNKPGAAKLREAVFLLRARRRYALADRLESVYERVYNELVEEKESDMADDNKDNQRVPQTVDLTPTLLTPPRGSTT